MGVGLNFFSDLSGIASKRLRASWLRRLLAEIPGENTPRGVA
jgi:hypothetical protein